MRWTVLVLAILFALIPIEGGSTDWPQWRGANRDATSAETGLVDGWPEDGPRVLWRIGIGPGYSSISVSNGKLYTMWDQGTTQYLFCLDAASGKELWRLPLGKAFKNHYGNGPRVTPLIDGKIVYAVGTDGLLVAVNKASGEIVWQHDLPEEFETKLPTYGFSSSPMVVGSNLLIEAGNLAIISASPDGFVEKAAAEVLSGKSWTAPSIAGGKLYLRNQEELVCLDVTGT